MPEVRVKPLATRRMRCLANLVSTGLLLVTVFTAWVHSETAYIGAEKCKLCHRSTFESWAGTAHRGATKQLTVADRELDCVRCHTTGPSGLPGVQCESCHGAGASYWPAEVMMDPVKARDAGLISPSESTCRNCHGSGLPNHSSSFSMPNEAEWSRVVHN